MTSRRCVLCGPSCGLGVFVVIAIERQNDEAQTSNGMSHKDHTHNVAAKSCPGLRCEPQLSTVQPLTFAAFQARNARRVPPAAAAKPRSRGMIPAAGASSAADNREAVSAENSGA